MIIFLIAFLCICLYKARFSNFHEDYMKKEQTGSVKGVFAIIIVFSHFRGYVELSNGFIDTSFEWVIGLFGQLMVTLFFFYSGYGILKSYKLKGDYAKSFFKKRILKTLLHFDLVVMLYVILSFIIKAEYSWADYVFAWVGWTAVGNSNWFIFVMLSLYVITLIAFFIPKKKNPLLVTCLVCGFSCVLFLCLYYAKKESWWMDTLFCYTAGMIFALVEDKLKSFMQKTKLYNYGTVLLSFICFSVSYLFAKRILPSLVASNITAVLFCLCVVFILTKIKIDNAILRWLGKYSFCIYICQRLPMIILQKAGISNSYLFFIISICLTLIISVALNYLFGKIDEKTLMKDKLK